MKTIFLKKILKPIYRHWLIQLPLRGSNIIYKSYIYTLLHKRKYESLKKFKGIHKGKRCFIVATGPSLAIEDVNKLKGEYTFSMNSIYKLFEKTDWRPTFYAIIDDTVFNRIKEDLDDVKFSCAFCPDQWIKWDLPFVYYIPIKANWCLTPTERRLIPQQWRKKKFGNDMTKLFYEGTSVVHFIMQIIFYMGFSEIYLLGTDCTAPSSHSPLTSYKDSDKIGNPPKDIYDGLMADYNKAKEIANKRGIRIYNVTRGGALEIFDRVELDSIIKS